MHCKIADRVAPGANHDMLVSSILDDITHDEIMFGVCDRDWCCECDCLG